MGDRAVVGPDARVLEQLRRAYRSPYTRNTEIVVAGGHGPAPEALDHIDERLDVGVFMIADTMEVVVDTIAHPGAKSVEDIRVLELPLTELVEHAPVEGRLEPLQRKRVIEDIYVRRRVSRVVGRCCAWYRHQGATGERRRRSGQELPSGSQ